MSVTLSDFGMLRFFLYDVLICSQIFKFHKRIFPSIFLPVHPVSPSYRLANVDISMWLSQYFTFMWPCIVTNFFVIKPTRCTNLTNLFCHETLHVSDSSSAHHQEFVDSFRAEPRWSCSKVVYKPVWHTPFLSVRWINSWWWADELSETYRVSWQNKFVKLLHLVGFFLQRKL